MLSKLGSVVTNGPSKPPSGDRRVRRTRATLQRALIELVEERDLPQIAVADVTEQAGVSRSTFYDHYQDVHELAEASCTAMIDDLLASLPGPADLLSRSAESANEVLQGFFTNLADHANLYRSLLGPQGSARIIDHIRRRATAELYRSTYPADTDGDVAAGEHTTENPHDLFAAFGAGAMLSVAIDWVQRGCPGTPAEMAASLWPLLATVFGAQAPS